MIEAQSRYIERRQQVIADMRCSRTDLELRIQDLEDQLNDTRAVNGERIRAQDARIWQLEEELTRIHDNGELGDAIDELRCDINVLIEEQDRKLRNLENVFDLYQDGLGGSPIIAMRNGIDEMRNTFAKVRCVEVDVDKLERFVHRSQV